MCEYHYQYLFNGSYHFGADSVSYAITFNSNNATLNKSSITLNVGQTFLLSYTLQGSIDTSGYGGSPKMAWESSRESVATVDNNGRVTAIGSGNATITLDPVVGPPVYCDITVVDNPPKTISLPATATTQVGETLTLEPTLTPSDAYTTITWKSSNENVATVSKGNVSAKTVGKTTIIATTDNGLSATCDVTVEKGRVTVSADVESGVYAVGKTVTLNASRTDADIFYTLDGKKPTTSSTRYTSPITLDKSVTLKAIATGSNYTTSSVLERQYTITSLAVKDRWVEDEPQTPYFIPTVTFSKAVSSHRLKDVCLTQDNDTVSGQALVQDGKLYFVPDEPLHTGSFLLTIPENAVLDANGEPNLKIETKLMVEPGVNEAAVAQVVGGYKVIKTDGTLWAWGYNGDGQLGDGTTTDRNRPVKVMDDVVQVATYNHTLTIKTDGTLWAWGYNGDGQLGDGTETNRSSPVKVMDDVVQVAAGSDYTLAIKTDGTLWAWGNNKNGQLGDGTTIDRNKPVMVLDNVDQVSISLALKTDGTLWKPTSSGYVKVLDDVAQVTESLAIKTDGSLWKSSSTGCYKVMDDVVQAAASNFNHTLAIKTDGTLWAWGSNKYGQLGDGTKTNRRTPVKVMDDVAQVAVGSLHSLAIKTDRTLWGWGYNLQGQLAGSLIYNLNPMMMMENVAQVTAGGVFTMAIKTDGSLWAWGDSYKKYSDGTITDSSWPIRIIGASPFSPVSSISLTETSRQLAVGDKCLVAPAITPTDGCIGSLSYESSNTQVATVTQRGIVEAKGEGTATITVTVDSTYTATFTLQVRERTMSVPISSAGYATFYDSQSAFTLPDGLTALVVSRVSNGKLSYQSLTSNIVPQDVAVMLTADKKQAATYILTRTEHDATYSGPNLLHGSDEATTTTGDGLHYKLTYGPSSDSSLKYVFGWYWGAQDGAPFQIEGHKAWLVLPQQNGTRAAGFSVDGYSLGIETLDDVSISPSDDCYDLQGRRVTQPIRKGLYIRNGKKVVK